MNIEWRKNIERKKPIIYEKKENVSHKEEYRKRKKKEKKRKVGKRKEEKEERKGLREMNSGVNASLRFAFTTIVEKGAFYNRKEVRKEEKEYVYQKVSNQRKGVYLSKGCLYYQRCQIKERVYMKKGKGGKKNKKKTKTRFQKKGIL